MEPYYDKNRRTISFQYDFAGIKGKMLAKANRWLKLWNTGDFNRVTFETIEPFLSKRVSAKKKDALREYASMCPDFFNADVFHCVEISNLANPKYPPGLKSRGGSPYSLERANMWHLNAASRHFYAYLRTWHKEIKSEPQKVPEKLKSVLKLCGIEIPTNEKSSLMTMKAIEKAYGFRMDLQKDPDSEQGRSREPHYAFYNQIILKLGRLKGLTNSNRIKNGDSPYIQEIINEILNQRKVCLLFVLYGFVSELGKIGLVEFY